MCAYQCVQNPRGNAVTYKTLLGGLVHFQPNDLEVSLAEELGVNPTKLKIREKCLGHGDNGIHTAE